MEDLLFWDSKIFKLYLFGLSTSAKMMLTLGLSMLKGLIKNRTVVVDRDNYQALFTHANRCQVETKFGGTVPNIVSDFWIPQVPNSDFLPESGPPIDFIKED